MCINPEFITPFLDESLVIPAYKKGFFPWSSRPCAWFSPNPRMVLWPSLIYKQKSLKRFFPKFEKKIDQDFPSLMRLCARSEGTWIDEHFIKVYTKLFYKGHAHSLELYQGDLLVGGIYGLIIGKVFFAESMVSLSKNASKVALVLLCELLKPFDFLIDCQIYNPHLAFMGAKNIKKEEFLKLIAKKCEQKSGFTNFKDLQRLLNNTNFA